VAFFCLLKYRAPPYASHLLRGIEKRTFAAVGLKPQHWIFLKMQAARRFGNFKINVV
jgi:hypothetical protein